MSLQNSYTGYSLPGPANQWGSSTSHSSYPGECNTSTSVGGSEREAAHGLADHNVSLDSQHYQRPQGNLTWGMKPQTEVIYFKSN
jgi:hypothetical protein